MFNLELNDIQRSHSLRRQAVEEAYESLNKHHVDRRRAVFFRDQLGRSGGYGTVQRAELHQSAYLPTWLASRLNGPPQIVAVKQIRMSAADDPFELKRGIHQGTTRLVKLKGPLRNIQISWVLRRF